MRNGRPHRIKGGDVNLSFFVVLDTVIRRLNFSSSVYLTKSDGYTIIFPVKYKGCDEDRTGLCAVQRVGNGGTPMGGFQISHHFRAEISKAYASRFLRAGYVSA